MGTGSQVQKQMAKKAMPSVCCMDGGILGNGAINPRRRPIRPAIKPMRWTVLMDAAASAHGDNKIVRPVPFQ